MRDNNNNKEVDIEAIKWAFEKGYHLGNSDNREGIFINFNEIQEYFLAELEKFYIQNSQSNQSNQIALVQ
ncbi:hypothetical protein SG34_030895 [Thalassomonas viridans]|uniref:Uncharacterized protein n=1 Tax=Thalassomonas viridans TaxID=137584 RepID=A0AAE9ZB84_9GAMM|nr:hypothetical protein [Thalassomonas viridans]WDE09174.1 hypothetical protein SG34_030895 [Thalassomonas viridans]